MKKHNFTLTEAVVICVMAALCVVVAVPAVNGSAAQGKNVGCMNNLRKIGGYVQIYADQNKDRIAGMNKNYTAAYESLGISCDFSDTHYSPQNLLIKSGVFGFTPTNMEDLRTDLTTVGKYYQCPSDSSVFKVEDGNIHTSYAFFIISGDYDKNYTNDTNGGAARQIVGRHNPGNVIVADYIKRNGWDESDCHPNDAGLLYLGGHVKRMAMPDSLTDKMTNNKYFFDLIDER